MELSKVKKIVFLIIILIVVFGIWKSVKYSSLKPDPNLYQVVLLRNDQAFYGKLQQIFSPYPYLINVYYLNPQQPQVDRQGRQIGGNKFTVVKRGIDEIHQPTDRIYFARENILYWENIGPESLVARGIKADKEWREKQKAPEPKK